MKKVFQVAGHKFSLSMKEGHPLWANLSQYDPFVSEGEDTLFDLDVVEDLNLPSKTLYFDQPTEPGETKIILYRIGEDWYFESMPTSECPVAMSLWAAADFKKANLHILQPSQALFALNNALMLLYAFSTASLNTLEMHASVIQNSGKAYLFLAKSGTGKSTHSRMWLENIEGSTLLNDDNPIVRVLEDGSVRVYGSPWSGKTACYVNEDYPVGAFVQIKRSAQNRASLQNVLGSYAMIYTACSGIKFDRSMADGINDTISKIVSSSKAFVLECRPDAEAAKVCYEAVR
ncbi:MAG: hypothetical protein ACI4TL_04230 [Candidatus Cryptobacteroides sp.]